ncbi:TM2 domain-containing protein 2 isoform X2 [Cygnus atratus]|uniref:TM2 domain-containing protein 2 isoform X2 n=1 Tax=Cygnus atratus TaxID=8868 RepID=UPI0015D5D437|nr:TM2 domain-containing protein 2 isoform X2 [Cygnus atratus]
MERPANNWGLCIYPAAVKKAYKSPEEFVECEEPVDHGGNATAQQELGHGCVKFGGQAHGDVDHTRVQCRALDGIECAEPRSFLRGSKPCISGSLLPGPHGDRRGEAADARRPRDLVVCGSDSPHHRRADAQRWQQLVHRILTGAKLVPKKTTVSPQDWAWTLPLAA